jgi:hypothetical protein
VIRIIIGAYITSIIAAGVATDEEEGVPWWRFWTFLTNWSYTVAAAYFWMAGISAIIFDVRLKKAKNNSADPFNKKLRETGSAWDMTLWIMFETCWVTGFIVFLLFWAVLVGLSGCVNDGTCTFNFYSWNAHGVNFAFLVLDMILNKYQFATIHVWFSMLFISVYECFSVLYRVGGTEWPYSVQDVTVGGIIAYIFYPGLLAGYVAVFYIALGLERLLSICHPSRHKQDTFSASDVYEESSSHQSSSSADVDSSSS